MKTKSFQEYLKKRLDQGEILQIKKQAQKEAEILKGLYGTHNSLYSYQRRRIHRG